MLRLDLSPVNSLVKNPRREPLPARPHRTNTSGTCAANLNRDDRPTGNTGTPVPDGDDLGATGPVFTRLNEAAAPIVPAKKRFLQDSYLFSGWSVQRVGTGRSWRPRSGRCLCGVQMTLETNDRLSEARLAKVAKTLPRTS